MTPFLKEVSEDIIKRHGHQLEKVAIVFNNKRPAVYMRHYLAQVAGKAIWSPAFFTIQQFVSRSSTLEVADELLQFFTLWNAYNTIRHKLGQEESAPDRFYPMAQTLLSDFAQIDYELGRAEEVYSQLYDIALFQQQFPHFTEEQVAVMKQFWSSISTERHYSIQERFLELWEILPQLQQDFKAALALKHKSTTAGVYRLLAEGEFVNHEFLDAFDQFVFIGFNALSRSEARLFQQWQDAGKGLYYFDTDSYYIDDPLQEAGHFLRQNLEVLGLRNAYTGTKDFLGHKTATIQVISASGFTAQAKVLHGLLDGQAINGQGHTAVLLADEQLLLPVLQSIPAHTLPNITMGYPIAQSPTYGLIDLWLTHQEHMLKNKRPDIPYKHLERYLAHPLQGMPPAGRERLLKQFSGSNRLFVRLEELEGHDSTITDFFAPVWPLASPDLGSTEAIEWLAGLLRGVFERRKTMDMLTYTEAAIIAETIKRLNQLRDNLSVHPGITPLFTIGLVRNSLQGIMAGIEGDPLSGLQVMGLLESRNLDFRNIYIVGANEGILPKISASPSFIPYSLRKAHGLPVLENQDALSAYLFYRLLQRAEKVTIIYNDQIDDQSTGEISRFVKQLAFESPFRFDYYSQQQPLQSASQEQLLQVAKTGKVWEALSAYLDEGNASRPGLSATSFATYIQSPLLFFLKYIAKLKEPDSISDNFELNKIGTVLHTLMQWFYEGLRLENPFITAERISKKRQEIPQLALEALSLVFYQDQKKLKAEHTNSLEKIMLRIVQGYAELYLDKDVETAPFTIVDLENTSDYALSFSILVDGQERSVNLYGIIDRVDKKEGMLRIVDYKTGADELQFSSVEDLFDYASGKSNKALLQTMYYTYIYERATGSQAVVPHLYTARKLRKEGSLFYTKAQRQHQTLEGTFLESFKEAFVKRLKGTLEELFDREVPFRHREGVELKYVDAYAEFLKDSREWKEDDQTA